MDRHLMVNIFECVMVGNLWDSFVGFKKSLKLFWEKICGTIDSKQLCKRIVPKIADEISRRPGM